MKVLCPHCERLVELERFRVEGAAVVVSCPRCAAETRLEAPGLAAPATAAASAPGAARSSVPPPVMPGPRVSLASDPQASNVVMLRTSAHEAVERAAVAAEERPFSVPEGLCPKCLVARTTQDACPQCGLVFAQFDEAAVLPPKWLRDEWLATLRDWGSDARHEQLRQRALQGGGLAAIGRLYRLRLAWSPGDPWAETGRTEVLRLAAASLALQSSEGGEPQRKAVVVGAFVVVAVLLLALLGRVLAAQG